MSSATVHSFPKLQSLPLTLPVEGAVRLELEEGVPIFRASDRVQTRLEVLLEYQRARPLSPEEKQELDAYEEIDDYLSLLNRVVRDLPHPPDQRDS